VRSEYPGAARPEAARACELARAGLV